MVLDRSLDPKCTKSTVCPSLLHKACTTSEDVLLVRDLLLN